ncbi:MAG: ribonuclease E/G [Pseudomonas marincola]
MATRMLIDASHDEETRVVIVKGTRLEEFDYETASKKQLKGNIYLAKVTRVEPSLQAAFVEYGGNRHGFLPFSEIHPDYYQVPVSDRDKMVTQENVAEKEALEQEDAAATDSDAIVDDKNSSNGAATSASDDEDGVVDDDGDTLGGLETVGTDGDNVVENLGGDDEVEHTRKSNYKRHYKIQDVIKRRQILLIQVVKEERGNKGAALTSYISLPGRYSVLMPNTGRGGGISRKISNPADRKRLKKIATELEVPEGVGVIIRTAGLNRTKLEIKRDYEFLLRLWDDIREITLKSIAPSCVYEEANLIKRSIRDLYSKEIGEILVEGEEGYRIAKDFMRKLMPSHAKKVQPYRDRIPLFHRFQVEQQFVSMYNPEVQLKSGGYIVINPTEALVSVDVNSGKATKERNIEDTAVKTNLEAAEEMARQLRLRDLAGLVVIDFIDMDDNRNNKAVERRLKDCLKSDRARIQVGRISPFGLLEMSRQRLRPSFLETSTNTCHTCGGSGFVRSTESTALLIIRTLEEEGVRERSSRICVTVNTEVAIYLLNQKRAVIQDLETTYGLTIVILADPTLNLNDHSIEREKSATEPSQAATAITTTPSIPLLDLPDIIETEDETDEEKPEKESNSAKRRRRRRRRKGRDDQDDPAEEAADENAEDVSGDKIPDTDADADVSADDASIDAASEDDEEPRKRRRGKRGGRRRSRPVSTEETEAEAASDQTPAMEPEIVIIPIISADGDTSDIDPPQIIEARSIEITPEDKTEETPVKKPVRRRTRRRTPKATDEKTDDSITEDSKTEDSASDVKAEAPVVSSENEEEKTEKVRPRRRRSPRRKSPESSEAVSEEKVAPAETQIAAPVEPAVEKVKPVKKVAPKVVEQAETPVPAPAVKEPEATQPVPTLVQESVTPPADDAPKKPARKGWWSRKSS